MSNQNNNNPNKKELRAWCRDKYGSKWFENGLNKGRLKEAREGLREARQEVGARGEVGGREEPLPPPPPPYAELRD